jgi:endonuclease/exonuclease/phosphatase (EEP) superfamily protein YafD
LLQIVVLGLLVRVSVRDSVPLTAWIYYSLPWPLLAFLAGLAFAGFAVAGRTRAAVGAALLSACCMGALWTYWSFDNPCRSDDTAVRILFWNISRGRGSWDRIADRIDSYGADIVALAEAGKPDDDLKQFWRDRFPDVNVEIPGGGLLLMTPSAGHDAHLASLPGISTMYTAVVNVNGVDVRLILVDLDASPRFDKRELVERVFDAANSTKGLPTIVVGDFNTPLDSRWFETVRTRFTHAFEAAGSGLPGTWPARCPLVAIDHVWLSDDVTPLCASIYDSRLSDHRALVVDLSL